MTTKVVIKRPRPHPGQRAILDNLARFNTIRAGRRYGKTILYLEPAQDTLLQGQPVGIFVQEYKYLAEVWRDFKQRLGPIIRRCNDSEHRMELITGGVLEGWTLKNNEDPARSRKYKLAIFDEAGLIRKLRAIWFNAVRPTLIDLEGRAIIAGTGKVQYPDFNWFCRYAESGIDPDWKHFKGRTFDNPYLPESERAEIEKQRGLMPPWQFGQEYEGEEAESVSAFFPRSLVDRHRTDHELDADHRGHIRVKGNPQGSDLDATLMHSKAKCLEWVDDPSGPWHLWCELDEDGFPDQSRRYASGWDLGAGVGSSNTVGSFGDTESRRKIAEFVDSRVPPEQAARIALMGSYFFGGVDKCAHINWEVNGPGEKFGQDLMKLQHPKKVRRREGDVANYTGEAMEEFGWWNSAQGKETLLTDYRADLGVDRFINPSARALDETLTYHYDEAGRIVSIRIDQDPIEELARMPHGDRVMADAILRKAMEQVGRLALPKEEEPPAGSLGGRVREYLRKNKKKRRGASAGW